MKSAVAIALLAAGSSPALADPICADRPGKGTGTCIVPAGRWQVETGFVDWTDDRSGGVRTDFTTMGSSLIKYGVSHRADIELGVVPYEAFHVRGSGGHERASGFGDMLARVKYRLTAGATVAVALDPFVKLPTARHRLGNGKVEAGLTMPMSAAISASPLSFALTPELDWLADGDDHGHHLAFSQVVGIGFATSPRLSLSAEVWGKWDWDQVGTGKQYSADAAVAYLASNSIQLDAGANVGLNRQTPDVELYAGVSKRF